MSVMKPSRRLRKKQETEVPRLERHTWTRSGQSPVKGVSVSLCSTVKTRTYQRCTLEGSTFAQPSMIVTSTLSSCASWSTQQWMMTRVCQSLGLRHMRSAPNAEARLHTSRDVNAAWCAATRDATTETAPLTSTWRVWSQKD